MSIEEAEQAELIRRAGKLFSGRVDFLLSAPQLKFLPDPDVPEIAFCGRSNVGKSSLLNALTGRRAIARTSVTPGRTQELNFFEVGEPTQFRLVDMPGYGFAKAPVAVVEKWRKLVRTYLRGRQVLARNLVLVDSRHGLKDVDREMMTMLDEAAVGYRVVLTKADKITAPPVRNALFRVNLRMSQEWWPIKGYPSERHANEHEGSLGPSTFSCREWRRDLGRSRDHPVDRP